MYTTILIPTDGSALAGKAVQHGIALAKPIGATITAVTVLPPFHTFATDRQMIEDTPAQYKIRIARACRENSRRSRPRRKQPVPVEHEHPIKRSSIPRGQKDAISRHFRDRPRQRDDKGPHPLLSRC
jgi:nucleotide-binding universal stress UspA family protein